VSQLAIFPALKGHKKRRPIPVGTDLLVASRLWANYLAPRPNSDAFGSNAFSNGPAIAATAAVAKAFG